MSKNLKEQLPRLQFICELKPLRERLSLLKTFSKDKFFCKAVREIVRNAVKKNITISARDRKKLLKYRKVILKLAEKSKHLTKTKKNASRRRLIYQTGTGIFLPIVLPLVFEIIRGIAKASSPSGEPAQTT